MGVLTSSKSFIIFRSHRTKSFAIDTICRYRTEVRNLRDIPCRLTKEFLFLRFVCPFSVNDIAHFAGYFAVSSLSTCSIIALIRRTRSSFLKISLSMKLKVSPNWLQRFSDSKHFLRISMKTTRMAQIMPTRFNSSAPHGHPLLSHIQQTLYLTTSGQRQVTIVMFRHSSEFSFRLQKADVYQPSALL